MPITISFLLIFFSCLSMHSCNARHLRVMDDKAPAPHQKLHFSTKALESVEFNRDDQISVREGSSGESRHATATVAKPKDSDNLFKEVKQNREMSSSVPVPIKPLVSVSGRVPRKNYDERSGNFRSSSHVGLLGATSIEGSRRRGLSVIEHGSHVQEGRYNKAQEDATATDYDPPHQKPLIHNRET